MNKLILSLTLGLILMFGCTENKTSLQSDKDWQIYGGNKAGNRYSSLDQISLENVNNLEVAWMYNATETTANQENSKKNRVRQIQCQPIVVNGILYGTTPKLKLFALDAGTGEQLWKFDPLSNDLNVNRGVIYWENGEDKRILYTVGSKLYAVHVKNGTLVDDFGVNGMVDLHEGLSANQDNDVSKLSVKATTPGVIYKNTLIMGSAVSESGNAAPGHIRAFDVLTGKLKWVFHTIPQPGETGYDTWPENAYKEIGGANSWAGLVIDDEREMVYFGTGSPSSDFYGGNREGKNLFANCVVALNADTGKLAWYYQTTHHDLWDRDLPCQPNLTTIEYKGKRIDVVVQAGKDGLVYVLDRDTGASIFPVEERPVPTKGLPGEHPWPTQKFPTKPLPLSRQVYTKEDITDISPESHAYIKDIFSTYATPHKYAPPSTEGTLLFGYSGGAEWGGNAIDEEGILYQNSNDNPWILQMVSREDKNAQKKTITTGAGLYRMNCVACHGPDRKGNGSDFPDITGLKERFSKTQVHNLLKTGSGRMPSFQHISKAERDAIVAYLFNPKGQSKNMVTGHGQVGTNKVKETTTNFGFKPDYVTKSWIKLSDQDGYPGIKPPWGTLNAIDLNTGDYLWRVPLGEYPELTKKGIPITGTESYGGPIVTASGLIFIAGTKDERIRAFDKKTGKVVWEHQLPAGGFATPITYEVNGRQYIVIAAGGGRGQKPGGNYVAFALPNQQMAK